MREIKQFIPADFLQDQRIKTFLIFIDESDIRCDKFIELQQLINNLEGQAILVMPSDQLNPGTRGLAKVHILKDGAPSILGVMPLDFEQALTELDESWGGIIIRGLMTWHNDRKLYPSLSDVKNLPIIETSSLLDSQMLERAKKIIEFSNCWLDPAGAVIAQGDNVLVEGVSTSFVTNGCQSISFSFEELSLNTGERMRFCVSTHAERVAIAKAAKEGIKLSDSTIYVNKFPCHECSTDIVGAGISRVVFERDSYGIFEANILVENGVELVRVLP